MFEDYSMLPEQYPKDRKLLYGKKEINQELIHQEYEKSKELQKKLVGNEINVEDIPATLSPDEMKTQEHLNRLQSTQLAKKGKSVGAENNNTTNNVFGNILDNSLL